MFSTVKYGCFIQQFFVFIRFIDLAGNIQKCLIINPSPCRRNADKAFQCAFTNPIDIRYTPELIFVSDKNIEYGVHIAKVLADTVRTEEHSDDSEEREP